jgi:hypothetical protein
MSLWANEGVEVNSTHSTLVLIVDIRVTMTDQIDILAFVCFFTHHMDEIHVHVLQNGYHYTYQALNPGWTLSHPLSHDL